MRKFGVRQTPSKSDARSGALPHDLARWAERRGSRRLMYWFMFFMAGVMYLLVFQIIMNNAHLQYYAPMGSVRAPCPLLSIHFFLF